MANIFEVLAQLEQDTIIERTKGGVASARAMAIFLGAPKGISKKNQQKAVLCEEYFNEEKLTVNQTCEQLEISRVK